MTGNEHPRIDHSEVAEGINAAVNYTMFAVFKEDRGRPRLGAWPALDATVNGALGQLASIDGLTTRGWYDLSGFRADADVLVWWHAPTSEALQEAYRTLLEWTAGALTPVWSGVGVHRTAEFNRAHVPAFLAGEEARDYVCVYPFVRGREWYLLPEGERKELLREHGLAARDYRDVLANTVSAFGLGDYEWLLAFESDELTRVVDMVRELRATGARRHVLEETPFFTGPLVDASELLRRALG